MTSEKDLMRIFDELLLRIQHIGIALQGQGIKPIKISGHYDHSRTDTPSIEETEDAFMKWNCAILTAFRGSDTLTPEANLERNIKRNNELKAKMVEQKLRFRSVNGCYREAKWEKPNVEYCFFVTNTGDSRQPFDSIDQIRDFFCKMYRLAEHYEQDSFLFTFPGANRVAFLIATNDDGRDYFRGDIKFAGPLFTHVSDIGDWTDCSDGRISFRLKGMIQEGGTGNRKIKIGEGDIFDVGAEGYTPNGLVVIRGYNQTDLKAACRAYKGDVPLVERYFVKGRLQADDIRSKVMQSLKAMVDQRCKNIGFHCSAALNGDYVAGAAIVLKTVQSWAQRYNRKFDQIVIVDTYGDYAKALNQL